MRNLFHIADDSYVVFIYPKDNQRIKTQGLDAKNYLIDGRLKDHFVLYPWENLWEDLIELLPLNKVRQYYKEEFYDKYLKY